MAANFTSAPVPFSAKLEINVRLFNRDLTAGMLPKCPAAASPVRGNEKARVEFIGTSAGRGRPCMSGAGCSRQPNSGAAGWSVMDEE